MLMRETIIRYCKQLEKEKNIRILFAIENGSRAWRMESKDSDYDVRFVYVRDLKDYLQIHLPSDVISVAYDEKGDKLSSAQGSFVDMSGFDIFKFVRMLSSSNPTTIEWLTTDIIYYGEQPKVFQKFAQEEYNPTALYHHYKSMCKNNYLKYLKDNTSVTAKKYLYAFRGLVNAKWVIHKKSIPPIIFEDALQEMESVIPKDLIQRIRELIMLKSQGKEKDGMDKLPQIDMYIESFLKDRSEEPQKVTRGSLKQLNFAIQEILLSQKKL